MKKDVSIILPSIRPENLIRFYESVKQNSKNSTFEIIIPGPYIIPVELMVKGNVTFLHTYANPTISFQLAALLSNAEYIYNTTDDGLLQNNALDLAIECFDSLTDKDMINMRYDEGVLDADTLKPIEQDHAHFNLDYWKAHSHGDLRLPGIHPDWQLCMHFFMKHKYFMELGGFDCEYEYSNHALHDLAFRVQANGGKILNLPKVAFYCSWLPEKTGDHGPVHEAQTGPDVRKFYQTYSQSNAIQSRIYLDYNNWQNYEHIWSRRFDTNNLRIAK